MKIDVVVDKNNSEEVERALGHAIERALTMIGMKVEYYAKHLCPVGTSESTGKKGYRGGTLRNSITYQVDTKAEEVAIGSNVEYAPYVELGTGPYFNTPPQWEQFGSKKGSSIRRSYVKPRPYLRPAIEEHIDLYKRIIEDEMRNA